MGATILTFIGKYWLEFLLGALATGLTAYIAKIKKTYKKGQEASREEEMQPYKDYAVEVVRQGKEDLLQFHKQSQLELEARYEEDKDAMLAAYEEDHEKILEAFSEERQELWSTFRSERERIFDHIQDDKNAAAEDRERILKALEHISEDMKEVKTRMSILEDKVDNSDKRNANTQRAVLSWYKKDFLTSCRELLEPEHVISFDEFKAVQKSHKIYNSLGGNHEGDQCFELVEKKYTNSSK